MKFLSLSSKHPFFLLFFFAAAISIIILFLPKFAPVKLPLFYSLPWGEGQLATNYQTFIIPATLIVITLLNLLISWQLHESQALFKNILKVTSFVCAAILLIAFIRIIFIFI